MKKSIFAVFLILAVCVSASSAQARKKSTIRRTMKPAPKTTIKTTTKTKTTTNKNMTLSSGFNESVTTTSGLIYIVTKKGTGAKLKAGDKVVVNYTGLLTNGQKFDSSLDRGEPFSFKLGAGMVIKGWDEGLQQLHIGDHATLIIPPWIGYGADGAGDIIPPNATLIFIIEVIGVK
ncbi:MAG TPA: FKBP-type peptidyl-prolyl cis-trans isomerase [Pyrinomonadaceae bacterium]